MNRGGVVAFSGRTHLITAILLWYFLFPEFHPLWVFIGSLLPDSDTKKSFAGRVLPIWIIAKHRGWTHSLWGLLLFSILLGYVTNRDYAESLALGYFLHLVMDWFTPMSVRWLGKK